MVLAKVRREIPRDASVMVVLSSNHSRAHVLEELRGYAPLVTAGCYLVVAVDTRSSRRIADATKALTDLFQGK